MYTTFLEMSCVIVAGLTLGATFESNPKFRKIMLRPEKKRRKSCPASLVSFHYSERA